MEGLSLKKLISDRRLKQREQTLDELDKLKKRLKEILSPEMFSALSFYTENDKPIIRTVEYNIYIQTTDKTPKGDRWFVTTKDYYRDFMEIVYDEELEDTILDIIVKLKQESNSIPWYLKWF